MDGVAHETRGYFFVLHFAYIWLGTVSFISKIDFRRTRRFQCWILSLKTLEKKPGMLKIEQHKQISVLMKPCRTFFLLKLLKWNFSRVLQGYWKKYILISCQYSLHVTYPIFRFFSINNDIEHGKKGVSIWNFGTCFELVMKCYLKSSSLSQINFAKKHKGIHLFVFLSADHFWTCHWILRLKVWDFLRDPFFLLHTTQEH